ncbi:uncharacterized protein LOC112569049 isoform X2 [Pomacea canaliculata]|nr:uncharacterized protein LOC112569049 isoform X2 [Pomacea canaliculata]
MYIELEFLILFVCLSLEADTLGMELQCPALFQDGENIITCKINKTAECLSLNGTVTFELSLNSEKRVACHSPYDPGVQCIPRQQHSPGSCWCEESSGDIVTYKFSYMASTTHDRGRQLECSFRVCPQKPPDVNISEGCTNIRFNSLKESLPRSVILRIGETTEVVLTAVIIVIVVTLLIVMLSKQFSLCFFNRKRHGDSNPLLPTYQDKDCS